MSFTYARPEILWQDCQPEEMVLHLSIHGRKVKEGTPLQWRVASELLDLLCLLFEKAQVLLVEPLLQGFSGARVLKVQPFYAEQGAGQQFVVKFGAIRAIDQEYVNYMNYVQHFIGGGRTTAIFARRHTVHLGGIIYSFLGTDIQGTRDFGTFYRQTDTPQINRVLDNLFRHTCRFWYANLKALCPLNLTEHYQQQFGFTAKHLERVIMGKLPSVDFQQALTFPSLGSTAGRNFTNPFWVLDIIQPLIRSTYISTTHGDLNHHNILIDQAGYPWLIDFQDTCPGHILRDVAALDAVIRFQLLLSQEATLAERLALEDALLDRRHFKQTGLSQDGYVTKNPALAKAYEVITHLHTLAHWIVEKNPANDMGEYFIALLYMALNTLQYSSLESVQHEHALLSASLIVDNLRLSDRC